ncbi:hypothetical protein Ptr902_13450 [Pyrenophora tritici-repentis]|nr:hypothetical protein Ptr902_13450 [Pyrenophora tritici-repentis]
MKFTTRTIIAFLVAIASASRDTTLYRGLYRRDSDDTSDSSWSPEGPPKGDVESDAACYGSCPGRGLPYGGHGCKATDLCRG